MPFPAWPGSLFRAAQTCHVACACGTWGWGRARGGRPGAPFLSIWHVRSGKALRGALHHRAPWFRAPAIPDCGRCCTARDCHIS
eukprot:2616741-Prymnesium_polylepis.2